MPEEFEKKKFVFNFRSLPVAVKTCAVRPVFALVVGELRGSTSKQCPRPVKQNASPGEQSEAPRQRWKPGQEQNPGPENQDSQHMLEQPRGSFPDHFFLRYRPKGVLGKGAGNNKNASEMRQKYVKNAPKRVLFYWEKRNVPKCVKNKSKCVKNASKMRGAPLGENTFWTIPMLKGLFLVKGKRPPPPRQLPA